MSFFVFCEHVSESASVDCVEIPFVLDSLQASTVSKCSTFPISVIFHKHTIFSVHANLKCPFFFMYGLLDTISPSIFFIQSVFNVSLVVGTQSPDPAIEKQP